MVKTSFTFESAKRECSHQKKYIYIYCNGVMDVGIS